MNKNTILKNISDLSNNAMFSMSLASQELFHSNFWAWMLRKYPQVFTSVFYPKYDGTGKVEVFREKYNFDLLIKVNDEFVIIENKVKSAPSKKQVDDYYKKIDVQNKKIVLVSYFKPLFLSSLSDFEEYISYETLYDSLEQIFTNSDLSVLEKEDSVLIKNYIDFLKLLNQFQDNIKFNIKDKISDLWAIVQDENIQEQLNKINFCKTFERTFIIKLTDKILQGFAFREFIDEIRVDCGRDLKVFSDMLFYFPGAWDEDESKRQDLCYLGVSLWGNKYRYYAGLHKAQCGITKSKQGRADKENKVMGFKHLSDNYGWLFNQESCCRWNGYSYDKEMYLYKKIDISNLTVEELSKKVSQDLEMIYLYLEPSTRGEQCPD